jgi:hypothetical protein
MDPNLKLVLEESTRRCCEEIRQAFADLSTSFSESLLLQQSSPPSVAEPGFIEPGQLEEFK